MTKPRRSLRRLAFALAVVVLCCLAGEFTLQVSRAVFPRIDYLLSPPWTRVTQADAELGYRPSPYYPDHDAWGFRNSSVPECCDLLCIGDSMTYGYAAEQQEESWPARLSDLCSVVGYNMSFGGYGPCEYLKLLREGLSLSPKVVVVGIYIGNDVSDAYGTVYLDDRDTAFGTAEPVVRAALAAADQAGSLPSLAQQYLYPGEPETGAQDESMHAWISQNLAIWGLLRQLRFSMGSYDLKSLFRTDQLARDQFEIAAQRPDRYVYRGSPRTRTTFLPPRALALRLGLADARIAEGYRIMHACLVAMKRACDDAKAALALVLIPSKQLVYADLIESDQGGSASEMQRLIAAERSWRDRLVHDLDLAEIPWIDPTRALRSALNGNQQLYPESEDEHPNRIGYAVIAESLHELVGDLLSR